MTLCPKCGVPNSPESLFCKNCQQGLYRKTRVATKTTVQSPIKPLLNPNIKDPGLENPPHSTSKNKPEEKVHHRQSSQYNDEHNTPGSQKTDFDPRRKAPKDNTVIKRVFAGLFLITIPSMLYLAYFILGMAEETTPPPDTRASSIFVQAENFYQKKSYLAAQNLYVQFIDEFPEEPLAEIVLNRIEEINNGLLSVEEEGIYKRQRIKILLEKSESILNEGSYSKILENNVLGLLNEVITLDSTNVAAPEMLSNCITIYRKEAGKAFSRGKYETAKKIYNEILTILPNDRETLKKLAEVNAAMSKSQNRGVAQNKSSSQQSVSLGESDDSSRNDSPKQLSLNSSNKNLAGSSRNSFTRESASNYSSNDSQDTTIKKNHLREAVTLNSSPNEANGAAQSEEKSAVNSAAASLNNNSGTSNVEENNPVNLLSSNTPILESFLDAGKRHYIQKVDPDFPRAYLKIKKEGSVIIEVVVGKDGRVSSHRVLHSDGELFTEVCLRALKNYRYKPGTVNNKLVNFKVTELFKFKLN